MKKLIISGSAKLQERAAYWRGYFEGRGYEVIDYPVPTPEGPDSAQELADIYQSFYQNIRRADVFFLMNEDQKGIGGYVGPGAMSEINYTIINNLIHGGKVEINILQMPSEEQACREEFDFWLSQGWIKVYERPTGKKAVIPVPDTVDIPEPIATPAVDTEEDLEEDAEEPAVVAAPAPLPVVVPQAKSHLFGGHHGNDKMLKILTCKKKCLRSLTPEVRAYLDVLSPEFPAWLLKYISAPEFQRLAGVSMTTLDYSGLFNLGNFNSVFAHSIGVAFIVWHFTHDKKQTLAGLFHDIAAPAFKHAIDYLNGDSEVQESIEERTGEIIRNSRAIMRQLKKDEILAGEISDYKLYPIADNDLPGLAADRLEYTLANGLFLFDTWDLERVRHFYHNLTVLKNEHDIDELGFRDPEVAKDFVKTTLPLFANYHDDRTRATLQFIADIIGSMQAGGYLTLDDLYAMSEREVIDWTLSCGDKVISDAFRQFQRATTVYNSPTAKKDRYCTSVKAKVRYCVPLAPDAEAEHGASRITELSPSVARAVKKYLDTKQAKYVGFDFEFTPVTE